MTDDAGRTADPSADPTALPPLELGFPGELRDRLVAAVLDGSKTATTGVVAGYAHEGEELPRVGQRSLVLDSAGEGVAVVEVTEVRVVPLGDVDLGHAVDEGEGHTTLAEWRRDHEAFWHGPDMRTALDDPHFTVDDDTPVVLERFRVVADLRA